MTITVAAGILHDVADTLWAPDDGVRGERQQLAGSEVAHLLANLTVERRELLPRIGEEALVKVLREALAARADASVTLRQHVDRGIGKVGREVCEAIGELVSPAVTSEAEELGDERLPGELPQFRLVPILHVDRGAGADSVETHIATGGLDTVGAQKQLTVDARQPDAVALLHLVDRRLGGARVQDGVGKCAQLGEELVERHGRGRTPSTK
jgi:hypothetical protein